MKKIKSISSFSEGEKIQGFFLCVEKHLRYTRSGDLYIDIQLRDITGHISGKIWDNVAELNKKFQAGNAVAVSGNVENFLDQSQLIIKKINKATVQHYGRYGFDPAKIVPSSKKNPKKLWNDILIIIKSIKNPSLRKLVEMIYRSNKKKIMTRPASVRLNHNYRSGFLEHVFSMAQVTKKIFSMYNVNRDLVIAGVFLHGIGILKAINSEYEADNTLEGNLIGHVIIGRDMVRESIGKIKKFPLELSQKIEHIILCHPGPYKSISPQIPSFPEALLVHHIQLMDSRMSLMNNSLEENQEDGNFTNRHNYFRIPLYKENEVK